MSCLVALRLAPRAYKTAFLNSLLLEVLPVSSLASIMFPDVFKEDAATIQNAQPTSLVITHTALTIPEHWVRIVVTAQRTGPAVWMFKLQMDLRPPMRAPLKEWRQWWDIWIPDYAVESLQRLPDGILEGVRHNLPLPK